MAYQYKYDEKYNANIDRIMPYGLNEKWSQCFANELTYAQVTKARAQAEETHGWTDKAKETYSIVENRIAFMLGMIDTLRALDMVKWDTETNEALCQMVLDLRN